MEYNFTINSESKIIIVQTIGDLFKNEVAEMDRSIRPKPMSLNIKSFLILGCPEVGLLLQKLISGLPIFIRSMKSF